MSIPSNRGECTQWWPQQWTGVLRGPLCIPAVLHLPGTNPTPTLTGRTGLGLPPYSLNRWLILLLCKTSWNMTDASQMQSHTNVGSAGDQIWVQVSHPPDTTLSSPTKSIEEAILLNVNLDPQDQELALTCKLQPKQSFLKHQLVTLKLAHRNGTLARTTHAQRTLF